LARRRFAGLPGETFPCRGALGPESDSKTPTSDGYSPVIAFAAGGLYRDSPLMLLKYVPVERIALERFVSGRL